MYVKICGLRDAGIALHAARHGADAIGVVMSPASPRHASDADAREVVSAIRAEAPDIDLVLVVNTLPAAEAAAIAARLGFDVLQLHGGYSRDDFDAARAILPRVWRATSIEHDPDLAAGDRGEERLLLDGSTPGSGTAWDLGIIGPGTAARRRLGDDWLLAGGLHPGNVGAAVAEVAPGGVDVSSGVESSPGVKDPELVAAFIRAARG
ncbi:phosphoribosylanthranilate isomerase [Leucobacter zeae]|nr:phosphoribosylanthranilate isomerase [Leucobacter zeae]